MQLLNISLFGAPRVKLDDTLLNIPRRKSVALIAYLALSQQPYSRDEVAALLWPELDQERARGALRSTLYALSAQFPENWLDGERGTLLLNRSLMNIDVLAFQELLIKRRLHRHEPEAFCDECLPLLESTHALYQGDFMAGFTLDDCAEYDNWQMFQRAAFKREYGAVLRRLASYYANQQASSFERALEYAQRWLALDPLHEPAHRLLMRLYAANGQRSEAKRQYRECVALLDAELATPPEEETNALYEQIQANALPSQRTAVTNTVRAGAALPPLPPLLVGREEALRDLKARLGVYGEMSPTTVIQGWPGVGKSTLTAALAHDDEIAQHFPDGVLWTSLGDNPNLLAELVTWGKALSLIDPSAPHSLDELSSLLRGALREKRVLLIVDDVWKVEHAAPFRVGGADCALLLTSRLNDVAAALAPTPRDIYRLAVLSENSALQLLAKLVPEAVHSYPEESRELVRSLEGLPLAIQVAGRLLQNEMHLGWGVGDLLNELRDGVRLLSAQVPGDIVGPWRDTTPTVAALLQRSTDSLDALTRERFADLGLFVPKPATFSLEAMGAVWGVADPKPIARALVNRGLLEPLSGGRFQMHALLVLHARSLLDLDAGGQEHDR